MARRRSASRHRHGLSSSGALHPGERVEQAAEVEQILDGLRKDDPTFSARARLVVGRNAWRLDASGPAAEFAGRLDNALRDTHPSRVIPAPARASVI